MARCMLTAADRDADARKARVDCLFLSAWESIRLTLKWLRLAFLKHLRNIERVWRQASLHIIGGESAI